jgi:hypothetical protein
MLKPQEIAQISLALWYLPLDKVAQIRDTVLRMKEECGYKEPIDDSDEWTDEDRSEFREAAMKRWDEREGTDASTDVQAG